MENYKLAIISALLFFPFLAFLITFPYIVYEYRKYGAIPLIKSIIVYSFILYLLTVYFLVILPLPPRESVAPFSFDSIQLTFFSFAHDFIKNSGFVWNQPNTYLLALKSSEFYVTLFNLLLFLPFGIYLQYYFGFSRKKTIFLSFLFSLFLECTQLSGLYGIYKGPYRLFDVDDLIINTLGGTLGYIIAPFFSFFLPSRIETDKKAYKLGKEVSLMRRLAAFGLDGIFFMILFLWITPSFFHYLFTIVVYFICIPCLTHGYTIGMYVFKLKIEKEKGGKSKYNPIFCKKWYSLSFVYSFAFLCSISFKSYEI